MKNICVPRRGAIGAMILVLGGVGAGLGIGTYYNSPGPHLLITKQVQDLGRVPTHYRHPVKFELKNIGGKPLTVSVKRVSCTCTTAGIPPDPIPPGGSALLEATIWSPPYEASFGADVQLRSNDPDQPSVTLGIEGHAVSVLRLSTPSLYFGTSDAQSLPLEQTVEIKRGALATDATLAGLSSEVDSADVLIQQEAQPTKVVVRATIPRQAPLGTLRARLLLKLADPVGYAVSVPIVAEITGPYKVVPSALSFDRINAGEVAVRECRIMPMAKDDDIKLLQNSRLRGPLSVSVVRDGDAVVLRAALTATADMNVLDENMRLSITHRNGNATFVQIPLMAIVHTDRPTK
jgi:hypothetical protein